MSKPNFDVQITDYQPICEIEGAWNADDYRKLLEEMDFPVEDGLSDEELRELCLMSLMEREPEDAAAIVLKFRLSDKMNSGQIKNASQEFSDEKLWEEYADLSLHESLFSVGSLLYAAFPKQFYTPDAVQITLEMVPSNSAATTILAAPLHESFLVRLLADGMAHDTILHRLFDEQLAGKEFVDAESIVWIVTSIDNESNKPTGKKVKIISSCHWLDALEDVESYKSTAMPDEH